MKKEHQRQTLLINRSFQSRLIFLFAAVNFTILAIFGFLFYLFIDSELTANLSQAHHSMESLSQLLLPIVLTLTLLNIIISTILIAIVILYASHRIAGPAYRFQQAIGEMRSKDLNPRLQIRKPDQFQAIAHELEEFASSLRLDINQAQDLATRALTQAKSEDQRQVLERLTHLLHEYRT